MRCDHIHLNSHLRRLFSSYEALSAVVLHGTTVAPCSWLGTVILAHQHFLEHDRIQVIGRLLLCDSSPRVQTSTATKQSVRMVTSPHSAAIDAGFGVSEFDVSVSSLCLPVAFELIRPSLVSHFDLANRCCLITESPDSRNQMLDYLQGILVEASVMR